MTGRRASAESETARCARRGRAWRGEWRWRPRVGARKGGPPGCGRPDAGARRRHTQARQAPVPLHPHGHGPLIRSQIHARPQVFGADGLALEAGHGQGVTDQGRGVAGRVRRSLVRGQGAQGQVCGRERGASAQVAGRDDDVDGGLRLGPEGQEDEAEGEQAEKSGKQQGFSFGHERLENAKAMSGNGVKRQDVKRHFRRDNPDVLRPALSEAEGFDD